MQRISVTVSGAHVYPRSEPGMALGLPDSGLCSQPHLPQALASPLGGSFRAYAEAKKPVWAGFGSDFPATAREEPPESPRAPWAWIPRQKH